MNDAVRIALVSDLHGNLYALETVLADIARRGVDGIACLGDVATLGPRPRDVLDLIADRARWFIRGNHDDYLVDATISDSHNEHPVIKSAVEWCRSELAPRHRETLMRFAPRADVELSARCVVDFFHGTPRSNTEDLLADTPPPLLMEALAETSAAVAAGGHTHLQMLRQHEGRLIVNPGSVGMPFERHVTGAPPTVLPHAEYAIVESTGALTTVSLHRIGLSAAKLRAQLDGWTEPLAGYLRDQYSAHCA